MSICSYARRMQVPSISENLNWTYTLGKSIAGHYGTGLEAVAVTYVNGFNLELSGCLFDRYNITVIHNVSERVHTVHFPLSGSAENFTGFYGSLPYVYIREPVDYEHYAEFISMAKRIALTSFNSTGLQADMSEWQETRFTKDKRKRAFLNNMLLIGMGLKPDHIGCED